MGNALNCIFLTVSKIIRRVYIPVATGAVMSELFHPVEYWISQIDVRRLHINFCSQRHSTLIDTALLHLFEQVQTLLDRAIAMGAVFTPLDQGAAVIAHLLRVQFTHIGKILLHQEGRPGVQLRKITRRIANVAMPLKPKPANIVDNRLDKLFALALWVGIVKTQMAMTSVFLRQAKIDANRLGVTYMQVTVGFGRKARHHLPNLPCIYIRIDYLLNEVDRFIGGCHSAVGNL